MNYFGNLYTIVEIAVNHNFEMSDMRILGTYLSKKDTESIRQKFPKLSRFLPYCNWYVIQGKNMLAMSAYIYDIYKNTGLLPDLENYDINPDREKLEHWQYINPIVFEVNPEEGFEFAEKVYPDCDVWNLFLSGSARMNYYEDKDISLEQRIKYAIVEYMMRRPQFYSTEDFVDNKLLHRKYNKNYKGENQV